MSQVVMTCDPLYIVIDRNERVRCHDGGTPMWETVPVEEMTSIWQPLAISDSLTICGAVLALWALAYGIKFVFHQVMTNKPGRF